MIVEWLSAFIFAYGGQLETILTGSVADRAALYAIISRLQEGGNKYHSHPCTPLPIMGEETGVRALNPQINPPNLPFGR